MKSDEMFTKNYVKKRSDLQNTEKTMFHHVSRSEMCFETVLKRKIHEKHTKNTKKCPLRSGHSVDRGMILHL